MMRLQNRWLRNLLFAAGAGILALFGIDWWFNPSLPTVNAKYVDAIEIHLTNEKFFSPKSGQVASTNVITDQQVIRKLLALFADARRGKEHKGVTSGTIVLRLKDGGREELGILPGYDDARYEYRYWGRINTIDRAQFLAILESIGILSIAQISHL